MSGKDEFVNSIIGEGSSFSGSIELKGLLRVDGDFSGVIKRADKVLVSKTGRVKSSIRSRVVVIGGAVHGDIIADERVTVLSTALVIGSIQTPVLTVEEGVLLHGFCHVEQNVLQHEHPVEEIAGPSLQANSLFSVDWQKLGSK
jgi:cytoskeletal protein CcmA (bactofilin family)